MITILHILPSLDPKAGGISQAVRNMIDYPTGPGLSHEVVCLDDPLQDFIQEIKFTVYALGVGKTPWNYNAVMKGWLKEHVQNYSLLIVHGLWQYQSYAIYSLLTSLNEFGIQLLVMPHGMLDPYFQSAKDRKVKAIRNRVFWYLLENKLINGADGLLFTCEAEKLLARKTFKNYHPKQEYVIGLGVNEPPENPINQKSGYLLFLGRIDRKKGVDLLIRAYTYLKDLSLLMPPLVVAGPGLETEFGKEVVRLAKGDPDISFPGMLKGHSKWKAFYECAAFVLPSHQENFGIAIVEALACSTPVLISDQINICQEIEEDKAGIVRDATFEGTVDLLKCWIQMAQQEQQSCAQNARICYEKRYTKKVAGAKLLELFSALKPEQND